MPGLAALFVLGSLTLPAPARAVLSRDYPGWHLAAAAPQIASWMQEKRFGQEPGLAAADFDSDGRTDYAVQIINSAGRQVALVLMARDTGYEKHVLTTDAPDPYTYLLVSRRGARDFDFTTLRWLRHTQDSVIVMYFDRTPLEFTWRGGKFERKAVANDEEQD